MVASLASGKLRVVLLGVVLAALLLGVGLVTHALLENALRRRMDESLQTMLSSQVSGQLEWLEAQEALLQVMAGLPQLQQASVELLAAHEEGLRYNPQAAAPLQEQLSELFAPLFSQGSFTGYGLISPTGLIMAHQHEQARGLQLNVQYRDQLDQAMAGEFLLGLPSIPDLAKDLELSEGDSMITMFLAGPVRSPEAAEIIAALSLEFDPAGSFTELLRVARQGESGETYAFDRKGLLLSASRFEDQLLDLGLLKEGQSSEQHLLLRDPGGDMTRGFEPDLPRLNMPLTLMAADALDPQARPAWPEIHSNVRGYRDYRGVQVVGAWTWIEAYGFGVATEIDQAEAYGPLSILRGIFYGLLSLIAIAALSILFYAIRVRHLRTRMHDELRKAKRLGQYELESKIGEGAMGEVYRAKHQMLRRPTAIKLLPPEKSSPEMVARFEREVQQTSRLSHPNTIEIYDYGRTPDNVFYYAMEFLQGLTLQDLVHRGGPLPTPRVIFLLRQMLSSLREAHEMGLVHRDIKPQNIFVCTRGGLYDVVKVLDFGLVRDNKHEENTMLTMAGQIRGTPMFMAPEVIESAAQASPASDLYAVGLVGYFMLSGKMPYSGSSVMQLLMLQASDTPEDLDNFEGIQVPGDIKAVIEQAIQKLPEDRFASAQEMIAHLDACMDAQQWNEERSASWWQENELSMGQPHGPKAPPEDIDQGAMTL